MRPVTVVMKLVASFFRMGYDGMLSRDATFSLNTKSTSLFFRVVPKRFYSGCNGMAVAEMLWYHRFLNVSVISRIGSIMLLNRLMEYSNDSFTSKHLALLLSNTKSI